MKFTRKNGTEKSKKTAGSVAPYVAGSIAAVMAIALLIINIILFKNNVNQYVAQGYPAADVIKQLIPSFLLPGIFEPIALYGGIAFVLFYIGSLNVKLSKCLSLLTKTESGIDDTAGPNINEENIKDSAPAPNQQQDLVQENTETMDDSKKA
jgi:hypothetical protein